MTDISRRRLLALLGTGATAVLSGCNRLFTSPEPSTPDVTPPSTPTPPDFLDGAETTTTTATETATATPSLAAVGDVITASLDTLQMEYLPLRDVTTADVTIGIENVGDQGIRLVDLRADLVYDPAGENRVVAVEYVGIRGLGIGESKEVTYETSFPNDGRADGSSDSDDFDLAFRIRTLDRGEVVTADAGRIVR